MAGGSRCLLSLASFHRRKLTRRMVELNATQMTEVKAALRDLLNLGISES